MFCWQLLSWSFTVTPPSTINQFGYSYSRLLQRVAAARLPFMFNKLWTQILSWMWVGLMFVWLHIILSNGLQKLYSKFIYWVIWRIIKGSCVLMLMKLLENFSYFAFTINNSIERPSKLYKNFMSIYIQTCIAMLISMFAQVCIFTWEKVEGKFIKCSCLIALN